MNYLRGDLRDQLAYVGREVVRTGLVTGSGGNLSARMPDGDSCWVTARGTWLDRLDLTSFVRVRISDGSVLADHPGRPDESLRSGEPPANAGPAQPSRPTGQAGPGGGTPGGTTLPAQRPPDGACRCAPAVDAREILPTSELELHLATYRVRPDVNAIVHLHPQTALLLDALGERIRLVTTDHGFYLRRVARVPFRLPGSTELAGLAAEATRDGTNCLVLSRHGCSVLADSVELAHKRAANLEEAARLTYQALVAGRLSGLPELPAEFLARIEGGATSV
ncbi:class II aldolase/adducin family protein [Micromonospora sp. WMMD1102]|uniref:class II aldolase/adducin family protein n=1 Tax=Micromonospora sp. WMMD1102 TaxID=3016105 RepID=UPI0024155C12|nr:class II aldolase/adducin family protein [Micromonospora sp. WMMD1102]MDG4790772.1 class II aldolase/adducin family protein [Micromonospora sp. WMMD1102]